MKNQKATQKAMTAAYRRYAHLYDLIFGAIFHPGRRTAIEHLHCRPKDRVLEVGVGTGLSLDLYPEDVTVVGIDLSPEMLAQAKKRVLEEGFKNVELLKMDAQSMTFPDNSFDKVVAMYVASVVSNPKKLVSEIQRVCKPGGIIIFLNHFENKYYLVRQLEGLLTPLAHWIGFHPEFPLKKFILETGFKPSQTIPVNLFDHWTILIGHNDK